MHDKIELLDHGFIRLVDFQGSDLSIVRNARVSYDAAWRAGKDGYGDAKLINYLYNHGHNTPFEAVTATFEVKAPIFVLRQWHRHRTQSYNELSARYRELPEEFYVPEIAKINKQSDDNKQMRTDDVHPRANSIQRQLESAQLIAHGLYKTLLAEGCPRELARTVLPLGTYSHMFATANLHNWFNFCRERMHEHAQYEIRVYAEAILGQLRKIAPVAAQAFLKKLNDTNV